MSIGTDLMPRLDLLEAGSGRSGTWVHAKTVPFAIFTQAIEGHYLVETPAGQIVAQQGEVFVSRAGAPLVFHHHPPEGEDALMRYHFVHFQFTLFETIDLMSLYHLPQLLDRASGSRAAEWIGQLLQLQLQQGDPIKAVTVKMEAAFRILNHLLELSTPTRELAIILDATGKIKLLLAFIRHNIAEPLTIDDLARLLKLSRSGLFGFFRLHFAMTPQQYLKTVRLNEAYRKLSLGDQSIAAVAEQTGFANPYHFGREFKQRFAITPGQFQRTKHLWNAGDYSIERI